ncbi:MAG: hypothetical protein RLZZ15_1415 [Verrucomicrobiota bacterium]|jgi:hypothetical protein
MNRRTNTALLLALSLLTTAVGADVRLFLWQEVRDEKSGEIQSGFFVAPQAVKEMAEAEARGDAKRAKMLGEKLPKTSWMYGIVLKGVATIYSSDTLFLFEPMPCGSELKVASGTVELDRPKGTMRVALKVTQDGNPIDFIGNGTYPIPKAAAKKSR